MDSPIDGTLIEAARHGNVVIRLQLCVCGDVCGHDLWHDVQQIAVEGNGKACVFEQLEASVALSIRCRRLNNMTRLVCLNAMFAQALNSGPQQTSQTDNPHCLQREHGDRGNSAKSLNSNLLHTATLSKSLQTDGESNEIRCCVAHATDAGMKLLNTVPGAL